MVIVVPAIHSDDAQPMARNVQSVARNHFRDVCRSGRCGRIHNLEQDPDQYQEEDHIDTMNINSFNLNSKCSVITANLKTSLKQVRIIVPYHVDTSSDGNIMHLHVYKKIFPRATKEQLVATRNKNIQLKDIMQNNNNITGHM